MTNTYFQSTHDSPLVAQMPTDQKLQFYKIQLEKQNNKIKIIETEKNILNSQNEELQIQMVRIDIYQCICKY